LPAAGEIYPVVGEIAVPEGTRPVHQGETVETGEAGRAVIRLEGDVGQVQVEPESSLQVGVEGRQAGEPPRLSLRLGHIWVYVRDPALLVASPLVEVTACEGALLRFRVVLDASTTVAVHRGTAWVRDLTDPEQELYVLGPGEGLLAAPGERPRREAAGTADGWLGAL